MFNPYTYRIDNVGVKNKPAWRSLCIGPLTLITIFVLLSLSGMGITEYTKSSASHRPSTRAEKKACYVYNLAKLIDWPETYRTGAFVIGYIGNASGYNQFSSYLNKKTIGSQRVYSTHIQNMESLPACHILFVDINNPSVVKNVSDQLPNPNTLLISHCSEGLKHGAIINLIDRDSLLRFELNEENAKRHQLFIGATLRSLATISEE